jgi:hypothetical protein
VALVAVLKVICQGTAVARLTVTMLGEEDAVVGLRQRAPWMLLAAQVSSGDGEEVPPGLLVCVAFGLDVQEDPQGGRHHAQDVVAGDKFAQHGEGHRDDLNSLGGMDEEVQREGKLLSVLCPAPSGHSWIPQGSWSVSQAVFLSCCMSLGGEAPLMSLL